MAARAAIKCTECGDILYIRVEDIGMQSVVCPCGATKLNSAGPIGKFEDVPESEWENLE